MTNYRIGFACKWIDNPSQINGISAKDEARKYSTKSTTLRWLNNQTKCVAEHKLWDLMVHNIKSFELLIKKVSELPDNRKMVRLSSELLPVYTEKTWSYFWQQKHVQEYLISEFAKVGDLARKHDVRLSFHPGQFTVLASDRPEVVKSSIQEFEYHAEVARMMGYARSFQDFKINVHISGRLGPAGFRKVWSGLSDSAKNTITVENEEMTYGLDDCLQLADIIPIVFDVHHHWIKDGHYINYNDDRIQRVIDSWRGVRPVMHYSQSRRELLPEHDTQKLPDFKLLTESGHKKTKLRAHSDYFWNVAVNQYIMDFLPSFDIMCESKAKNLASAELVSNLVL